LKKAFLILLSILFILSCEDKKDTTPPDVTITSPQDGSTVNGIVSITCNSDDNEGVDYVELWVNGDSTDIIDNSEPYSLEWNTASLTDVSYSIVVRSYDKNGNFTDSNPIEIFVRNGFIKKILDVGWGGYSVKQTNDGGFVIVGYRLIIKTDSEGNIEWEQHLGEVGDEVGFSIQQTTDGGYIISGITYSLLANGRWDAFLLKTDSNGNEEWKKVFIEGDNYDIAHSVDQTLDGGYIFTGFTQIYREGRTKICWLIKVFSDGEEEWRKIYLEDDIGIAYSVKQTLDGGYIVTGSQFLLKAESNGNVEWNKNDIYFEGQSIEITNDGGYIIGGSRGSNRRFAHLIKTDSRGNKEWEKQFDYGTYSYGKSCMQTEDGGYILTGHTEFVGEQTSFLLKTDSEGNKEWDQIINEEIGYRFRSVDQATDGGYILTGSAGFSTFLIKTDSEGNIDLNNE